MIEEAALRDARRLYQFLDRGRAETLVQHRLLGDVHDPLARPPALVRVAAELYRGCSFFNRLVHHAGAPSSKSQNIRSEERRVGKKCGRTCRLRWSPSK